MVFFLLASLLSNLGVVKAAGGEEITVQAAVDSQQVYVGESFLLQIQVNGADSPAEPDLSGLTDFQVQPLGGQQNNSESITIINGRMERISRHGYIFNYHLTPKRAGSLVIPSLSVPVSGRNYQTRPLTIIATKPAESDDFKLRLALSKTESYVGEPLSLTVTWYVGKDVDDFQFNLPMLDDSRFSWIPQKDPGLNQQNAVKIALGRQAVIGRKGKGVLDGRKFLTVTLGYFLIPHQTGAITLAQGSVTCKTLVGYRRNRQMDPFGDFFGHDFFGSNRQGVYQTVITPSNEPELVVKALPTAGKPDDFTGLVGEYSIAATATPTKVRVGDPITLAIMVTGPEYLDNVTLPPLQDQQSLAADFKIPEEMAAGEVKDRVKTFTQTIRANRPEIKQIPAISLSFFNPASGKYETAHTDPIPLEVESARIVTARDAEGGGPVAPVGKQEIKATGKGIAHNYEDPGVLANEERISLWIQSDWGLLFLAGLPLLYLLLLGSTELVRRRRQDPEGQRARKAYAEFLKELSAIGGKSSGAGDAHTRLGEALRNYLGKKLRLPAGAITFSDVRQRLAALGIGQETLMGLRSILEQCEAHRFGGAASGVEDVQAAKEQCRSLAKELERSLK